MLVDAAGRLSLWSLENRSRRPYAYAFDRRLIPGVRRRVAKEGKRILGTLHSHPASCAVPSLGDLRKGFYKDRELIYDVSRRDVRL